MEALDDTVLVQVASFLFLNELTVFRLLSKSLNARLTSIESIQRLMQQPKSMVFPAQWGSTVNERSPGNEEQKRIDEDDGKCEEKRQNAVASSSINVQALCESLQHGPPAGGAVLCSPLSSASTSFNFLNSFLSLSSPLPMLQHLTFHAPVGFESFPLSLLRTYRAILRVCAPSLVSLCIVDFFCTSVVEDDKAKFGDFGSLDPFSTLPAGLGSARKTPEGQGDGSPAGGSREASSDATLTRGPDATAGSTASEDVPSLCPCDILDAVGIYDAFNTSLVFPALHTLTVLNTSDWSYHVPYPTPFHCLLLGEPPRSAESTLPSSGQQQLSSCGAGRGSLCLQSDRDTRLSSSRRSGSAYPVLKVLLFYEFSRRGFNILKKFLVQEDIRTLETLAVGAWQTRTVSLLLEFMVEQNDRPLRRFRKLKKLLIHGARFIWPDDEWWWFYDSGDFPPAKLWRDHFAQERAAARGSGLARKTEKRGVRKERESERRAARTSKGGDQAGLAEGAAQHSPGYPHKSAAACEGSDSSEEEVEELPSPSASSLSVHRTSPGEEGERSSEEALSLLKKLPRLREVVLQGFVGVFTSEFADDCVRFFGGVFPRATITVEGELVIALHVLPELAARDSPLFSRERRSKLIRMLARQQSRRKGSTGDVATDHVSREASGTPGHAGSVSVYPVDPPVGGSPTAARTESVCPGESQTVTGDPGSVTRGRVVPHPGNEDALLPLDEFALTEREGIFLTDAGKDLLMDCLESGMIESMYALLDHRRWDSVHLDVFPFHADIVREYISQLTDWDGDGNASDPRDRGEDWGLPAVSVYHRVTDEDKFAQDYLDLVTTFRRALLDMNPMLWQCKDEEENQQDAPGDVSDSTPELQTGAADEEEQLGRPENAKASHPLTKAGGVDLSGKEQKCEERDSSSEGRRDSQSSDHRDVRGSIASDSSGCLRAAPEQSCCSSCSPASHPIPSPHSDTDSSESGEEEHGPEGGEYEGEQPEEYPDDRTEVRLAALPVRFPNVVGLRMPLYSPEDVWPVEDVIAIAEAYKDQTQVLCLKNCSKVSLEAPEADLLPMMARDFAAITRICLPTLRVIDYRVYRAFSWEDEVGVTKPTFLVPAFLLEFLEEHPEFSLVKRLDAPPVADATVLMGEEKAKCRLTAFIWIRCGGS